MVISLHYILVISCKLLRCTNCITRNAQRGIAESPKPTNCTLLCMSFILIYNYKTCLDSNFRNDNNTFRNINLPLIYFLAKKCSDEVSVQSFKSESLGFEECASMAVMFFRTWLVNQTVAFCSSVSQGGVPSLYICLWWLSLLMLTSSFQSKLITVAVSGNVKPPKVPCLKGRKDLPNTWCSSRKHKHFHKLAVGWYIC